MINYFIFVLCVTGQKTGKWSFSLLYCHCLLISLPASSRCIISAPKAFIRIAGTTIHAPFGMTHSTINRSRLLCPTSAHLLISSWCLGELARWSTPAASIKWSWKESWRWQYNPPSRLCFLCLASYVAEDNISEEVIRSHWAKIAH